MPRSRKTNNHELGISPSLGNWDELDEVTKRRLRNRLSQRHFRERRSMYIKSLEESTKASSQTESARNKALAKEISDLRAATLKIRTQILKISHSLNYVGAEVGRILNVAGSEKLNTDTLAESQDRLGPNDSTALGDLPDEVPIENNVTETDLVSADSVTDAVSQGTASRNDQHIYVPNDDQMINALPQPETSENPCREGTIGMDLNNAETQATDSSLFPEPNGLWAHESSESLPAFDRNYHDGQTFGSTAPAYGQQHLESVLSHRSDISTLNFPFNRVPVQTDLILPQGHFPASPDTHFQPLHPIQTSRFSHHIEMLELQVRSALDAAPDKATRQRLTHSCSAIMSLFVRNAWPSTSSVWFKSQVPEIIGPILLWRLYPSSETYNLLGVNYKPTELQLSVPHSAVIDWVPYPDLRDRVIRHYNHSVALDRLLCDMMNSYVIEVADLSRILPQASRGRAYFGIWNIYRAIDAAFGIESNADRTESDHVAPGSDFGGSSPEEQDLGQFFDIQNEFALHKQSPPAVTDEQERGKGSKEIKLVDILTTPASVLKLSHDIRLYATKTWRFDKSLFDKWPELKFDGYENIVAKGRSCRIPTAPPDGPKQMTDSVMRLYQMAVAGLS